MSCIILQVKEGAINKHSSPIHDGDVRVGRQFGTHFIIELIDCPPETLTKADVLKKIMFEVVERSRTSMVDSCFHQFEPHGASGIILIQESHYSVHTWPEAGYAAADIFTCGTEMDPYIAIEVMKELFKAGELRYHEIKRGI